MHLEIAKEWKEMGSYKGHTWRCRKVDCFQLGWPMREDGDFFKPPDVAGPKLAVSAVCIPLFFQCIWLFVSTPQQNRYGKAY
jgi:hypothetical protein